MAVQEDQTIRRLSEMKWKEKVETLIDFFVLRRVQVYTQNLVKAATFFLRVYLPEYQQLQLIWCALRNAGR